jgi:hypothetical protein
VQVGEIPVALLHVEAVPHEQLVWNGESYVADGQVVDQPPVGAVEERHGGERGGVAKPERLAQVVQGQAGVDHVLDDEDVAAGNLLVQVLQEADPRVAARIRVGAVGRELDEVEGVRDSDGTRQVRDEDEARLQGRDEERLTAVVVADDVAPELADAVRQLLSREVDLADLVPRGA